MQSVDLPLDILYGNSSHSAHRMGKIPVDHFAVNTDGLKNLGALVGLDGADSHLGGDLYNSAENGIVVILHRRIIILIQHMAVDQLLDGFLGQIGIDGAGAIAEKRCKVMHLPGLPGLHDKRHACFLLRHHQMTV